MERKLKKTPKNFWDVMHENSDKYEVIKKVLDYHDGEKHYNQYDVVLLHNKSGKYYKTSYSDWGSGGIDPDDDYMTEVFYRERVITEIYFE